MRRDCLYHLGVEDENRECRAALRIFFVAAFIYLQEAEIEVVVVVTLPLDELGLVEKLRRRTSLRDLFGQYRDVRDNRVARLCRCIEETRQRLRLGQVIELAELALRSGLWQ